MSSLQMHYTLLVIEILTVLQYDEIQIPTRHSHGSKKRADWGGRDTGAALLRQP